MPDPYGKSPKDPVRLAEDRARRGPRKARQTPGIVDHGASMELAGGVGIDSKMRSTGRLASKAQEGRKAAGATVAQIAPCSNPRNHPAGGSHLHGGASTP